MDGRDAGWPKVELILHAMPGETRAIVAERIVVPGGPSVPLDSLAEVRRKGLRETR